MRMFTTHLTLPDAETVLRREGYEPEPGTNILWHHPGRPGYLAEILVAHQNNPFVIRYIYLEGDEEWHYPAE